MVNYTGKSWKHHISEHFEENDLHLKENGAGAGGTIFTDYHKMIDYLKADGRKWHVAELILIQTPIVFEFGNDFMATILIDWVSIEGFKPLNLI